MILLSPREQIVRERTFDRRSAAALTALVMLAIAGVAVVVAATSSSVLLACHG